MIIPINKKKIPYRFDMKINGAFFTFEIHYNQRFDFVTVKLIKNNKTLVVGEKLILNKPLFEGLANIDLPKLTITPKDRANIETRTTYDNLSKTVFLYVEKQA